MKIILTWKLIIFFSRISKFVIFDLKIYFIFNFNEMKIKFILTLKIFYLYKYLKFLSLKILKFEIFSFLREI